MRVSAKVSAKVSVKVRVSAFASLGDSLDTPNLRVKGRVKVSEG